MSEALRRDIARRLGRRALFGEPLGRHTTWGVGGPAWCLCRAESAPEAAWLMAQTSRAGLPLKVMGRGSNLLVADEGYPGLMLMLRGDLARVELAGGGLICGGGASLARAVRRACQSGLAGLEWAVGIPATVGGAMAGNAGAHGSDMASTYRRMTVLLPDGVQKSFACAELSAGYRRLALPAGAIIVEVSFAMPSENAAAVMARRDALLARRKASQPLAARTAGSVFKNPPGDFAGRLIEAAGLKGLRVGGAAVSQVHANFIENVGGATAAQIRELMALVALRVRQSFGVELEPEVEVLVG